MAQATAVTTYDAVGNRDDLQDLIDIVAQDEAPLYTKLKRTKASARYHEWLTDSLSVGQSNKQIEGRDYTFTKRSARTRVGNYTQILDKLVEVSDTQRAVDSAGLKDEFSYQMDNAMTELKTDVEYALIQGTSASGATGTARSMSGFLEVVSTNVATGTGTGNEALTEDMFNDNLQTIWAAGGRPGDVIVNGFQKRQISGFTSPGTRFVKTEADKRLSVAVDIYESDFGVKNIWLDPQMANNQVLIVDMNRAKLAILRPVKFEEIAKIGDATRGVIKTELTLQWGNELAHGKITQLTTS